MGADLQSAVVYLLIPTSNHNYYQNTILTKFVVYLLIPTSNHNDNPINAYCFGLFIS